jgi:phosphoribosylglycinamide formyltransferase-1
MEALIEAAKDPEFPAEIRLVVSNNPGAGGLERAAAAGIETSVLDHRGFDTRDAFENALHHILRGAGIELVCLAGFMRLLTDTFVDRWHDKLINIHPSLLPAFPGLHVHERAIEAGTRFSGCTVHFVRPAMDDGPIIGQAVVAVFGDDTPDSLAARVLVQEHRLYPLSVRLLAEGRVRVIGEKARIDQARAPESCLVNPMIDEQ